MLFDFQIVRNGSVMDGLVMDQFGAVVKNAFKLQNYEPYRNNLGTFTCDAERARMDR